MSSENPISPLTGDTDRLPTSTDQAHTQNPVADQHASSAPSTRPEEAEVCCICSSDENLIKTDCDHQMHLKCLLEWSQHLIRKGSNPSCPICRAALLPAASAIPDPTTRVNGVPVSRIIRTGHAQHRDGVLEPILNARVTQELDEMVNVLMRNMNHQIPSEVLFDAVTSNQIHCLEEQLIMHPEQINVRRPDESTLLHHAVYRQNIDIVDFLLINDANPRISDRHGITPLHCAVTVGNSAIARRLLGNGANVEAQDRNGETPLIYAMRAKDTTLVSLLVRKGADITCQNHLGHNLFHMLAQGGFDHNIVTILKERRPQCLGIANFIGDTCLHVAIEHCNINFIRKFKHLIPYHCRFQPNHVGLTAEDYVVANDDRYEPIRRLLRNWQRPDEHEQHLNIHIQHEIQPES